MYLEELAEFALGLIFVFLIISLAVMQIQEVMAGWFRWRSKQLEKAIRSMLTDRKKQQRLREVFQTWYSCAKYLPDVIGLDLPASPIDKLGEKISLWWEFRRVKRFPSFVDKLYEHLLLRSLAHREIDSVK